MFAAVKLLRTSIKCNNSCAKSSVALFKGFCTSHLRRSWPRVQSADVERYLLRKDRIPETYQLVYRAPMENYVAWTKNISTATISVLSLVALYQAATTMNFVDIALKLDLGPLVSEESDLYYFVVGFVLINLAIRMFVAKYPLRIYKSPEKYVAVYGSQLPLGTVKHYFHRGEIKEYKNFLNPWRHIMYKLGSRSSMLLVDYFKSPSEFEKLFSKE
ncbi:uncharacterized protein LOC115634103 [Scaptodrosophila lebanonensis]|uniref:Uncharacterized protein LOC115634103 n=1 Tax=Drosophila lebanonensis TaxID=7225 RepID=A0A6J2UGF5_DROLE|nr:uncharacterized protein LOC115634103 [Scaptodrosophila lebanonensis]